MAEITSLEPEYTPSTSRNGLAVIVRSERYASITWWSTQSSASRASARNHSSNSAGAMSSRNGACSGAQRTNMLRPFIRSKGGR